MGRRFYIGVLLLVLLLALALTVNGITRAIYEPMEQRLRSAGEAALDQDWATALSLTDWAEACWQRYRHFTASVADQSPMDDADRLFGELSVYGRCRDREHFAATCQQLAVLCSAMGEAHSGAWWDLLLMPCPLSPAGGR